MAREETSTELNMMSLDLEQAIKIDIVKIDTVTENINSMPRNH